MVPQLRAFMEGMAERWWFAPEHNDPMRQVFKKTEPKKSLQVDFLVFTCWAEQLWTTACMTSRSALLDFGRHART